jgi:hypothetical protein
MSWRWDRHGNLVPELADLLRGRAEVRRLEQDQGLSLDLDQPQLTALGRAVAAAHDQDQANGQDHDLDQLVAQLRERNRVERKRLAQVQRPRLPGDHAQDFDVPDGDQQQAHGQGGSRARQVPDSPVQNETIDLMTAYLAQDQDDAHEWSPT